MAKRTKKPTEAVEVVKRQTRRDNAAEELKDFSDEIERFGTGVSADLVAGRDKAQRKMDRAYDEPSEYNVHAATSAVSTLTKPYATTGIRQHLGSSKSATRNKEKQEFRQQIVREWHRKNPNPPWGWQSQLAQYLSQRCMSPGESLSKSSALQYLKRHKFFLD